MTERNAKVTLRSDPTDNFKDKSYSPALHIRIEDMPWLSMQVNPRRKATSKNRAVSIWSTYPRYSSILDGFEQAFYLLYRFQLDESQLVMEALHLGWPVELINEGREEALKSARDHGVPIEDTACTHCAGSGCECCAEMGWMVEYEDEFTA